MTTQARNKSPELPTRSGERPTTGPEIPRQQLDQTAPAELQEDLLDELGRFTSTRLL
jgi:hypothetical protein